MAASPANRHGVIGSVQRAVDLLDAFGGEKCQKGVDERAASRGTPESTVAGIVYTLVRSG